MQVSTSSAGRGGYRLPLILVLILILLAFASSAWASGWPPFAREDNAVVARGGQVSILIDGSRSVLDNDFDIEQDRMIAILTRDVKHGELVLNENGTFVYIHDGKKKKNDEFKYVAFDGTGYSRETKVKIDVEEVPNSPPFTIGNPGEQEAQEGAFFSIELARYFGDSDEDDSLRFSASGLPRGDRLSIDPNSGILAGTPNESDVRDNAYNVRITATDNAGADVDLEFELTIFQNARADLELTASVAVNPVTVGEAAQWNINILNRGPSDLDEGELVAQWTTNGPNLSMVSPPNCTLSANNSTTPTLRCAIDGLAANSSASFNVRGTQNGDGDNSLIAIAVADDPNPGNNAILTGAVVVTAFSEGPTQIIDGSASSVDSGDLNGDGKIDIVVSSGQTVVYFNSGNRTVTTPGLSLGSGSGGNAVVILDWDGDTDLDIAVAGMNARAGRIYLNAGDGSFPGTVDLNVAGLGVVNAVAAADFDQDGADEVVFAGTGNAVLLRSSGGSGFASSTLPATSGMDAAVADVNNDGLDDIIVVQSANRLVRIMTNSGDGRSFSNMTLDRGSVAGATPADVDLDGDIDLLLAIDDGELEVPESKVVYQQVGGGFSAGTNLGASPLSKMLAADINKDGVPDAIAINASGVHQIYRGLPSGGFSLEAEQIVSEGMQRGVLVDFNGDDSTDLIFVGSDAGVMEIHANNGRGRLGRGDRSAPVISLIGAASMTLAAGEAYNEPGATATDDIDGDVTELITINGSVNTNVVGTYSVTYTASDKSTNSATVSRSVQVGVNQGTGGSGGGVAGPLFILYLLILLRMRRRYPA